MNFIAGYLILITKNEEESFWLLDALVGRILPGRLKVLFAHPSLPLSFPSLPLSSPLRPALPLVPLKKSGWPSQDGVKWLRCNSGIERFLAFVSLRFNITLEREKEKKKV